MYNCFELWAYSLIMPKSESAIRPGIFKPVAGYNIFEEGKIA